jgi:predicted RNA binding protein YcfA (HicA-like mRNA interferase family)
VNRRELLRRLRTGGTQNVSFADLQRLAEGCGFRLARVTGSHHIYHHPAVPRTLNLQPEGRQAKSYQVRQFLSLLDRYNLGLESDDE